MRKAIIGALLSVSIFGSAFAGNTSSNTDGAVSSLRGRLLSPKFGDFHFYVDQEIRSTTDFGVFKDSRTSAFAIYDPLSWLRIGAGYTFLVKEGSDSPSIKHRPILFIKQYLKVGNFSIRFRERFESTFENGRLFGSNDSKGTNLLRTRLKINYSNGQRVVPYIYTELYNHINDAMTLSRIRSQAGVEYKLNKNSKLTAFYQYAHYLNYTTSTAPHTVGVLYAYTLSKKSK